MHEIDEVPIISLPEIDVFERDFLRPSRPVVIRGAMDDWKALSQWTDEYLSTKMGDVQLPVRFDAQRPDTLVEDWRSARVEWMTFGEFTKLAVTRSTGESHYIQAPAPWFPPLKDDVKRPIYSGTNGVEKAFWFAGGGNVTPLHYDLQENLHAVISGEKRFVLYSPRYLSELYPSPALLHLPHLSRINNIECPDLTRFPRFTEAKSIEVVVRSGDILYLPCSWWHQVYSPQRSVALNFWWKPRPRKWLTNNMLRLLPRLFMLTIMSFYTPKSVKTKPQLSK